ncbi:MAG TPA: PDZ domain-containing protein [Frankiaceae bacterium]|nr:PDZ domain-containing protein [Frankiaceae bacterium]
MSSRGATLGVSISLALGLGVGGSQLPVPYVGLGPGPMYNTLGTSGGQQLIEVPAGRDHPARGELNLTTVNVYPQLSLGEAIGKWFDRSFAVVPREVIFPPDQSEDEVDEETRREMTESQEHAVTAALCELGTPVRAQVAVDEVTDGSPAAVAGLKKDDVISEIDGSKVDSVCTLRRLMRKHKPGDVVRVGYTRAKAALVTVEVKTRAGEAGRDGAPLMGVGLREGDQKPPFPIKIALEDVGGPSAGLMFALGIYDRLTPGDLTGGQVIAGTGSIDDDGTVGAIGGIQQKLVAAKEHGAKHFLVPDGNWDDANAAKPEGLTLVRVAHLRDALVALEEIAAGRER